MAAAPKQGTPGGVCGAVLDQLDPKKPLHCQLVYGHAPDVLGEGDPRDVTPHQTTERIDKLTGKPWTWW